MQVEILHFFSEHLKDSNATFHWFVLYNEQIIFDCSNFPTFVKFLLPLETNQINISKCPFGVIILTKIPTKDFKDFCPSL